MPGAGRAQVHMGVLFRAPPHHVRAKMLGPDPTCTPREKFVANVCSVAFALR